MAETFTRDPRERSAAPEGRAESAAARDAVAHARDRAAAARDRGAELRDRDLAPDVRVGAAADRELAARDRAAAARDRFEAQADREVLMRRLALAETDALTGTRARGAGLADLEHEIDRARRTTGVLATAYVDVVGLKSVNDERGHSAGDALLRRIVSAIRDQLRSYDPIVRLGGDEFLCVMSGATIESARGRFRSVQGALAGAPDPCEIKVGFAALAQGDSADDLIARADAELPTTRRG